MDLDKQQFKKLCKLFQKSEDNANPNSGHGGACLLACDLRRTPKKTDERSSNSDIDEICGDIFQTKRREKAKMKIAIFLQYTYILSRTMTNIVVPCFSHCSTNLVCRICRHRPETSGDPNNTKKRKLTDLYSRTEKLTAILAYDTKNNST